MDCAFSKMLGSMTKTARVLIVDDHEIVRMGLRIVLAGYAEFEAPAAKPWMAGRRWPRLRNCSPTL